MKTNFVLNMTPRRLVRTDVLLKLSTSILRQLYLEEATSLKRQQFCVCGVMLQKPALFTDLLLENSRLMGRLTRQLSGKPTVEWPWDVTWIISSTVLVKSGFHTGYYFSENYPQFKPAPTKIVRQLSPKREEFKEVCEMRQLLACPGAHMSRALPAWMTFCRLALTVLLSPYNRQNG
jgi:hypothetical protein